VSEGEAVSENVRARMGEEQILTHSTPSSTPFTLHPFKEYYLIGRLLAEIFRQHLENYS
jgi:hypothetical protein